MKEHPVLFNGEMVRAILEGSKTQTRRVIKPQPENVEKKKKKYHGFVIKKDMIWGYPEYQNMSPYGKPDDQLWVRETWLDIFKRTETNNGVIYKADYFPGFRIDLNPQVAEQYTWRASIHMFRWASRIQLLIKDIRIERVQDISEEDAKAEGAAGFVEDFELTGMNVGIDGATVTGNYKKLNYKKGFKILWDSINTKPKPVKEKGEISYYVSYPWEDIQEIKEHRGKKWYIHGNPWVWIVEFEKIK